LAPPSIAAFIQGLADLGYTEGKNVVIERFVTSGDHTDDAVTAATAVATNPDVIFAYGAAGLGKSTKALTSTIPIVVFTTADPVPLGLAASLAHPGGNLTGTISMHAELASKQLGILKDMVPNLARLAIFEMSINPANDLFLSYVLSGMGALGLDIIRIDVAGLGEDFQPYFERAVAAQAQAIYYLPFAFFWDYLGVYAAGNQQSLSALQLKTGVRPTFDAGYALSNNNGIDSATLLNYLALIKKLPALGSSVCARAGGLATYSSSPAAQFRLTGQYVARVLKGSKPQDLPIVGPTTIDFEINLKTAGALGITIPPSILAQATLVIE
jgi:putative ABC transport system substrate-binding protein